MRVIDLTHPISSDLPAYFPWHPKTEIAQTATYEKQSCEVRRVSVGTHSGTHIDAPSHIFPGFPTIDLYDPGLWYSEVMVLDFTGRAPREAISGAEVRAKGVERGLGVLFKTGWDSHFGRDDYYATYPPISSEAAEFLSELPVLVVAADTPFSLDVHRIFLRKGIPLITNIANTDRLPEGRLRLIAAPLLVRGGDGAPARVLAVLEP